MVRDEHGDHRSQNKAHDGETVEEIDMMAEK